jgi:pre-mRNA-splicing factor 18
VAAAAVHIPLHRQLSTCRIAVLSSSALRALCCQVGLWVMIQLMAERNYLAANDIYLKLAIGNAPWPIGVTHVGLHERSAREKISHVMNSSSQAHIMNDEATRKFFQVRHGRGGICSTAQPCYSQMEFLLLADHAILERLEQRQVEL